MIGRVISRFAGKPFAQMDEFERLQWGFMLSWCLVFNVLPLCALAAYFAGWLA